MATTEHLPTSLALRLARWFDERLSDTDVQPTSRARLYGLEVLDHSPLQARTVFIAEAADFRSVINHPSASDGFAFDAAAVVEFPWISLDQATARPGSYSRRERGRVVRVITNDGDAATLCRVGDTEVCAAGR